MGNPDSPLPPSDPKGADSKPNTSAKQSSKVNSSKQDHSGKQDTPSSQQKSPRNKGVPTEQTPSRNEDQGPSTQPHSPLLILNHDNFREIIASKDPTLVMFHTTWCGSCKTFKPKFQEVAEESLTKIPLKFALYDSTDDSDTILDEYDIVRFPTVKLFRDGKYEREFEGKLTLADLKEFVAKWGKGTEVAQL